MAVNAAVGALDVRSHPAINTIGPVPNARRRRSLTVLDLIGLVLAL
jgi:hypothetical protein